MGTINTDSGRIKLIRNCKCGGNALFSFHTNTENFSSDVSIECLKCGANISTEFEDINDKDTVIDRVINNWNRFNSGKLQLASLYGEMVTDEKEYGCVVCEHLSSCKPNPFGVCSEFERKKSDNS